MVGGIIIKEFERKKNLNVLLLHQHLQKQHHNLLNDLFNKFKDFDKFKIHNIEGSKKLKNLNLE
jgi:hypothetical protein